MSQIAVRLLEVGGVNSPEDSSGLRTFMQIMLREAAGATGCGPFENKVDRKSWARYDMGSALYLPRYSRTVAQIGDGETAGRAIASRFELQVLLRQTKSVIARQQRAWPEPRVAGE
jgi:hypothetical protein